ARTTIRSTKSLETTSASSRGGRSMKTSSLFSTLSFNRDYWDGFDEEDPFGTRLAVLYALFDFGPTSVESNLQAAEHEAAHAVVAWRLGIPVRRLFLNDDGELRGSTIC